MRSRLSSGSSSRIRLLLNLSSSARFVLTFLCVDYLFFHAMVAKLFFYDRKDF
ncbi:MAG: hypothetical protein KBE38_10460 [Ignavibacterium sp.]|nr:hypothetical protein [Ignavibacterium sp.]